MTEKLYRIKPLEWNLSHIGLIAKTPCGYVVVCPSTDGKRKAITGSLVGRAIIDCGTSEQAKAAAWDAYVAKMEEWLEVVE